MRKFMIGLFTFAGFMHFRKPETFDALVPDKLPPSKRFWTYASGAGELATALFLTIPKTQRIGGLAAAFLSLAVWPGNFQMAWDWRHKPWYWQIVSIGRLPLQIPLIKGGWKIGVVHNNQDGHLVT